MKMAAAAGENGDNVIIRHRRNGNGVGMKSS
jgi:hypothetical protein